MSSMPNPPLHPDEHDEDHTPLCTPITRHTVRRAGGASMLPFRTATGQTGMDAYVYAAAAIRNRQAGVDDARLALAAIIRDERPDLTPFEVSHLIFSANDVAPF